jgi:hypothetical protein
MQASACIINSEALLLLLISRSGAAHLQLPVALLPAGGAVDGAHGHVGQLLLQCLLDAGQGGGERGEDESLQ